MTIDPLSLLKLAPAVKPLFTGLYEKFIRPTITEKKTAAIAADLNAAFARYYSAMWDQYSSVHSMVLPNQNKKLWDLYIPLRVKSEVDQSGPLLIDHYHKDFLPKHKKILITETAGMGKSTLLKFLFLDVLLQNHAVPVLIELRNLKTCKSIEEYFLNQLTNIERNIGTEVIKLLGEQGVFAFFFDGFDEVAAADSERTISMLLKFVAQYHTNNFIISSRPDAALRAFTNFIEFYIEPLKRSEAYELLRRYDSSGSYANKIIEHLEKQETQKQYASFLQNPLLVSLLFKAYTYNESIPIKKAVFYRTVYESLYWQHDHTKGAFVREKRCRLDVDSFHRILRSLGMLSILREQVEFTTDQILEAVAECNEMHPDLSFINSDFICDLHSSVPIFQRIGESLKWAHKSFAEYFASQFIYVDEADRRKVLSRLASRRDVERYLGVLEFYMDSDPKDFREVVLLPILQEYSAYMKNNVELNRIGGLSDNSVELRCSILFEREVVIRKIEGARGKKLFAKVLTSHPNIKWSGLDAGVRNGRLMLVSRVIGTSKHGLIACSEYISGKILLLKLWRSRDPLLFCKHKRQVSIDAPVFANLNNGETYRIRGKETACTHFVASANYDDLNDFLLGNSTCVLDFARAAVLQSAIEAETSKRLSVKNLFKVKARKHAGRNG